MPRCYRSYARFTPLQVYGYGTPRRDFTFVDDVVDGIVAALALAAPEEIFVSAAARELEPSSRQAAEHSRQPKPFCVTASIGHMHASHAHTAERKAHEPHWMPCDPSA